MNALPKPPTPPRLAGGRVVVVGASKSGLAMARFLGTWIDLKRKDGTIDALYGHWILGRDAKPRRPRWSILRDVLHWAP